MSILLGSEHVYTKQKCIKRDPKLTVPLSRILAQIKTELLKFNIKVQRPLKKDLPFCNSLWVRDPFINVNNKLLMLPLQTIVTRNVVEWKSIPAAASRRKAIFPESPENLEGGDVIQDGALMLVGVGKRTNDAGVKELRRMYPKKRIIKINHFGLHLDCSLMILPGKKLIYSTRYITNLPSILRKLYKCKTVESIIGDSIDPLLATNGLLIGNNIITTDQVKFKIFLNYLRSEGFNVIEIKYGNLWRDQGGIRCLTQWIKRPKTQKIF